MKVKIEETYQAAIIELKGNLIGGENAKLFREKLYELIDQNKKNLVVDMTDVKLVSSTGIGILISGYTTLKNAGGDLKLAHISDKVQGVLNITKLNQIFNIYDNVDEAVKSFS
ncbi:MAG: STAS domain-containing protein [Ignavibacteriaceae bacterium]|nr:STAS domain-containing protein [Ignavibacteriaceae bacterium]